MPFSRNADLPDRVKNALPEEAQTVFRRVANSQMERGLEESRAFASAWSALRNQGWRPPDNGGKWRKVEKAEFRVTVPIAKTDSVQRVVYGWAKMSRVNGEFVVDQDGDWVTVEELEKASHSYLLNARGSTDRHITPDVARPVASIVFTPEIQKALGVEVPEGWFVGLKVDSDEMWPKIEKGEYAAFSIGGSGVRLESDPA